MEIVHKKWKLCLNLLKINFTFADILPSQKSVDYNESSIIFIFLSFMTSDVFKFIFQKYRFAILANFD